MSDNIRYMKSSRRTARWTIALFAIGCFLFTAAAARSATISTQVDFSRLTHPKNQLGFTHGAVTHRSNAAYRDTVVARADELMPGLWRGVNQPWSFDLGVAQDAGATPIHILGDEWNSSVSNPKPGCNEMFWNRPLPFQNLTVWKNWVAEQAAVLAANQPTGTIWVDIWNEPDWNRFWPTQRNDKCYSKSIVDTDGSKWLATFLAAEQTLRHTLGSRVKISGPSAATSVMNWTTKLVNFCAAKGCKIDAIAWHLCGGTQGSVDLIGKYTTQLRGLVARDAKWSKATAGANTLIWMTEYIPSTMRLFTGSYISYWYALERAGVDGGALAEWNDVNSSLDSLLEENGAPRATWWAARAYAMGRASRVYTQTSSGYYSLLATRSGIGGNTQILIGNNNVAANPISISLRGLNTLGWSKSVVASIHVLPQIALNGSSAMPELPAAQAMRPVAIKSGAATIQVTPPRGGALLVNLAGS